MWPSRMLPFSVDLMDGLLRRMDLDICNACHAGVVPYSEYCHRVHIIREGQGWMTNPYLIPRLELLVLIVRIDVTLTQERIQYKVHKYLEV